MQEQASECDPKVVSVFCSTSKDRIVPSRLPRKRVDWLLSLDLLFARESSGTWVACTVFTSRDFVSWTLTQPSQLDDARRVGARYVRAVMPSLGGLRRARGCGVASAILLDRFVMFFFSVFSVFSHSPIIMARLSLVLFVFTIELL